MSVSLFDSSITSSTPGVVWLATTTSSPAVDGSNDIALIDNSRTDLRAASLVDPSYVSGGGTAYVAFVRFNDSGNVDLHLSTSSTDSGGSAGPELTNSAELNLGLALRRSDGTVHKWTFDDFSDTTEPYRGVLTGVNAAFNRDLGDNLPIQLLLVDRSAVDWDNLQTLDAPALTSVLEGTQAIRLNWYAILAAERYELYAYYDDAWHLLSDQLTHSTHLHSGLTVGKQYWYQVRGITSGGVNLAWSNQTNGITIPDGNTAPTVTMPARDDNRVFGETRILLAPTIGNPAGNTLSYAWEQTGGASISNPTSSFSYIVFPRATASTQTVTVTLTVRDPVTNANVTGMLRFQVVPEPAILSLFHRDVTTATAGVAWHDGTEPDIGREGSRNLVGAPAYQRRAEIPIESSYLDSGPGYVTNLGFSFDRRLFLYLGSTAHASDFGVGAGPQLTSAAEQNLGFALMLPDGTTRKWQFSDLTASDAAEPYVFSAASVAAAGPAYDQALSDLLADFWTARLVFVDHTHSNIDWDTLNTEQPINATVVTDDKIVEGGTVQLVTGNYQGPSGSIQWRQSSGGGFFDYPNALTTHWTAPAGGAMDTTYRLTFTVTRNGMSDSDYVDITVRAAPPTVTMPTRDDNRVFGETRIALYPTIGNPAGNTLNYIWTQTGGASISSPTTSATYIVFPRATSALREVTVMLRVTDTVTNRMADDTISFQVVPEPTANNCLFHREITTSVPGVAWYDWTHPEISDGGTRNLVESPDYQRRAEVPIASSYLQSSPGYVTALSFQADGRLLFYLATTATAADYGFGTAGPQLTSAAEQNLGLALLLPDGSTRKWRMSDLVTSDTAEPYNFSAASVTAAGPANDQALRDLLADFWTARLILVDRTHSNIDWNNLRPQPPTVAITTPDQTVEAGATVRLTATATGTGLRYLWRVDPQVTNSFGNTAAQKDATWAAPTPANRTIYTLTLTATDICGREISDTVRITVPGLPPPPPTVTMPARDDNRVFGETRILLAPTIGNPAGNTLSYAWEQTGGASISNPTSSFSYIVFPRATASTQTVTVTLTVRDPVTNANVTGMLRFQVVPEPAILSLFHRDVTTATAGVAWHDGTEPGEESTGNVSLVESPRYERRAEVAIVSSYLQSSPGYVTGISFQMDGRLILYLDATANATSYGGGAGPQLTSAAEQNLGLALMLPDGSTGKWRMSDLVTSDADEPYLFSAASVAAAGSANDQALRDLLADFWTARLILVDRMHAEIDWSTLCIQTPKVVITAPVPTMRTVAAGAEVTLASTTNVPGLTHEWTVDPAGSSFANTSATGATWTAPEPDVQTEYTITLAAKDDGNAEVASDTVVITVLPVPKVVITAPVPTMRTVAAGAEVTLASTTNVPGLTHEWTVDPAGSSFANTSATGATWTAPEPDVQTEYTITLAAKDDGNAEVASDTVVITVLPVPKVVITAPVPTMRTVAAGAEVTLASTTNVPGLTHEWTVDPAGSSFANTSATGATWTAPEPDVQTEYTITLAAKDDGNAEVASDTVVITVLPVPKVVITAPVPTMRTVAAGAEVTLASTTNVPGLTHEWTVDPAGSSFANTSATGATWTAPEPDVQTEYTITLAAKDDGNAEVASDTVVITVLPVPKVVITAPVPTMRTVAAGAEVTLASTTNVPGLTHEWTVDPAGSSFANTSATGATWTAPEPDVQTEYTITLAAKDDGNAEVASDTVVITVLPVPKVVITAPVPTMRTVAAGAEVTLASTTNVPGLTHEWTVDPAGSSFANTSATGATWTAPEPDVQTEYTITLAAKDDGNAEVASDTVVITVLPVPKVVITAPVPTMRTVAAGAEVTLASTTNVPGLTHEWTVDPAGSSFANTSATGATWTAPEPDVQTEYTITLAAKDDGNAEVASDTVVITVLPVPKVVITAPVPTMRTVAAGAEVTLASTTNVPGLTHEWTVDPAGSSFANTSATGATWTAPEPDVQTEYTITLAAKDDGNAEVASDTVVITVLPVPKVVITAPVPTMRTVAAGAEVTLASTTNVPGLTHEWTVDPAGSSFANTSATGATWTAPEPDVQTEYTITLAAKDDGNAEVASDTVVITVLPVPKVVITAPVPTMRTVAAGAEVTLASTTNVPGLTHEWTVDPAGSSFANTSATGATWTAPEPDVQTEYTITLAAKDDGNAEVASDTVVITVLPVPKVTQAEILPPLTASIDGAARWPGGLVAEVESYRATMFGGPDAATLNVEGPEVGLRWLLTQLRRPLQLQGQQAGPVWWGYVHRVEARLGAVTVTASLDGLRTAIAVTCPDAESGATECREFQLAQPLAEQYGRIEMLNAVEDADAATEAELAELLAPHLSIARALEHSGQAATGARLYARGWSAALDWRFAPRHSGNARFGDATKHINELARPALGTSGDEVEWAAWCDFGTQGHPGYDLYLSSARLLMTGPAEGAVLTDPWMVGVRGRGSNGQPDNRLGAEIALDASDLPRVSASAPYAIVGGADARLLEFDFSGQEILLPQAGFFVTVGGALTPQFQYVRTDDADPLWSGDAATGVWSWGQVGSNGWAQASNDAMKRPVYDFSVRAKAPGLLRMLLEEHDILRAGPAPEEVGAQSYGLYLEGKETVAQRLAEVHKAERLGYVVDATRTVRFFESGESVWRLGRDGQWQTQVARGAMPFLGQHVRTAEGRIVLCERASYTPRTGLWQLGFRALPTAG